MLVDCYKEGDYINLIDSCFGRVKIRSPQIGWHSNKLFTIIHTYSRKELNEIPAIISYYLNLLSDYDPRDIFENDRKNLQNKMKFDMYYYNILKYNRLFGRV